MEFYNPQTKEWNEFKSLERGFPNGIKGYILYDNSNHMSVHLVPKDYENTDLIFPSIKDSISIDALNPHYSWNLVCVDTRHLTM